VFARALPLIAELIIPIPFVSKPTVSLTPNRPKFLFQVSLDWFACQIADNRQQLTTTQNDHHFTAQLDHCPTTG
jgi:hypothetical protein